MARKQPLLALPLFLALALLALALVETRPGLAAPSQYLADPRPNGWVVDQAGTLPPEAEAELDRLGDRVKADTGAELAVVVIDTTGGADPRRFAVDLANRWVLGSAERDDGLLVFAALEDRAAEIVLGDGIGSTRNRGLAEQVMQATIVPLMRRGDPQSALLEGARACAAQILGASVGDAEAPPGPARAEAPPVQRVVPEPVPAPVSPTAPSSAPWRPAEAGDLFTGCSCLAMLVAALAGFVWLLRRMLRPLPRPCPKCKAPMVKLGEAEDDARLEPGERAEEQAGGANWQVWCCPSCQYAEKLRKVPFFTRTKPCPKCGYTTLTITADSVNAPTQLSEGLVRVWEACGHCGYSTFSSHVVPRQVPGGRTRRR